MLNASPLAGPHGLWDTHFELLETGPDCRFVHGASAWNYPDLSITGAGYVGVRRWDAMEDERAFLGATFSEGLGTWIANLGDVNGNGSLDLGISGRLQTFLYDSADWSAIGSGPPQVLPWPDVDSDGRREVLLGIFEPTLYLGSNLAVPTWVLPRPLPYPAPVLPPGVQVFMGELQDSLLVDDHDGDGVADYLVAYAGKPLHSQPDDYVAHTLMLYSGATGDVLADVRPQGDWRFQHWGTGIAAPGDLTGDGVEDFLVRSMSRNDPGCPEFPVPDPPLSYARGVGSVNLLDGATAQVIDVICPPLEVMGVEASDVFGWGGYVVAASHSHRPASPRVVPDVDGNGAPEVLLDYYVLNESGTTEGYAVLVDTIDHDTIWCQPGHGLHGAGYTFDLYELATRYYFPGVALHAGDVDQDSYPDIACRMWSVALVLSCRPVGVRRLGPGRPALDGRVPRIGCRVPSQARGRLPIHTSDLSPGQSAWLVLGRDRATREVLGADVLVPEYVANAGVVQTGPFVRASHEVVLPRDSSAIGARWFGQWVVAETQPAGGLHLATSPVLEVVVQP